MSIKDTMTRFDEKFPSVHNVKSWGYEECDCTSTKFDVCRNNIKKFIQEEIKLALEGITPEETRIMKNSNPERRCGFIACLEKIEELKNNYLKLN